NLPAEEGVHADVHQHEVSVKERRKTGRFEAVDGQVGEFSAQAKQTEAEAKLPKLYPAARYLLELPDDYTARPAVGQARPDHQAQAERDDRYGKPGEFQGAFQPFSPACLRFGRGGRRHGAPSPNWSSILSRERVSSSQRAARREISRWISSSRIWSCTFSRGGTA